jgi:hypothetical protein
VTINDVVWRVADEQIIPPAERRAWEVISHWSLKRFCRRQPPKSGLTRPNSLLTTASRPWSLSAQLSNKPAYCLIATITFLVMTFEMPAASFA